MKKMMIFLLLVVLVAGCSTGPRITHIYAFGDDFSDNGNCVKLIKEAVSQNKLDADVLKGFEAVTHEGRYSDGPVAVEVLADQLKVGLTNHAVCGASSGQDTVMTNITPLANTGLFGQIDKFESELKGEKADPDALYFLETSFADFYLKTAQTNELDEKAIADTADQAITNINTAITRLAKLGAKQFLVGNSPDLSIFPDIIARGVDDEAKVFQTRMNSRLPGEMEKIAQQLNIKINVFDYIAASDRIRSNPGQYGLTNLTDPCNIVTDTTSKACATPDKYYFWTIIHLSHRVHQIIGEAMAEQLSK